MRKTLAELRIGSYSLVHTVEENTSIIDALKLFVQHRVSALPVVDDSGIYAILLLLWAVPLYQCSSYLSKI